VEFRDSLPLNLFIGSTQLRGTNITVILQIILFHFVGSRVVDTLIATVQTKCSFYSGYDVKVFRFQQFE
jgi:hypothetical protein